MRTIRAMLWFIRSMPRYWADAQCSEMEARWEKEFRSLRPERQSASDVYDDPFYLEGIFDGDDMD